MDPYSPANVAVTVAVLYSMEDDTPSTLPPEGAAFILGVFLICVVIFMIASRRK